MLAEISGRSQITIPSEIIKKLGIAEGDKFDIQKFNLISANAALINLSAQTIEKVQVQTDSFYIYKFQNKKR